LIEKELLHRDPMQVTGLDSYTDFLTVPKVLQVKDFGKASRTKCTCVCVYACVYVCVCVYACVCSMSVCVCVYVLSIWVETVVVCVLL